MIEEFHDNGNVRQRMTYEGGEKHGPYAMFYDDNAKWIVGAHERGVEHGKHQRWWKNGTLAQDSTYVAGQLDGVYKRWYANGKEWETGRYANGKLVGPYRKWWKNGKPAQVAGSERRPPRRRVQDVLRPGAKWASARTRTARRRV